MITKIEDFKGRFNIALSEDIEPNSMGNHDELQLFIEDEEPSCLVTVLGYSLYQELLPELKKKPFEPDASLTAADKWVDLVNGKDNYQGLKKLLVPYIYFQFLANDTAHHTGVGMVQERAKGASNVSARKKAVVAWNEYYKYTVGEDISSNIFGKNTIKGPVIGIIYSNSEDKYWSLYNWLKQNIDVYTNWSPSSVKNITMYGI